MYPIVRISPLLPETLRRSLPSDACIMVPTWAFTPDAWNTAFLRGLASLAPGWNSERVWEVGVGPGINVLALHSFPCREFYISDFNPRCISLALENLALNGLDPGRYCPLEGSWDLVTSQNGIKAPQVDVIYACIPQVPADFDLEEGDNIAHYYRPDRYPDSRLHMVGLGLVEALLKQARSVLKENGSVVLNLGGRPGINRLREMFEMCGYAPRVVHEEIVPQHPETSIGSFVALEKSGHAHFEFFADNAGLSPINALAAQARRDNGLPLFHKIYIMEGTLLA